MFHSFVMVKWNPDVYLLTKLPHPYHSRYASSPALPASVTAHSSRSWMTMKGDYNHQNGGNGDLTPGNMFFCQDFPRNGTLLDMMWAIKMMIFVGWKLGNNDEFCWFESANTGNSPPCSDHTVLTKLTTTSTTWQNVLADNQLGPQTTIYIYQKSSIGYYIYIQNMYIYIC